MGCFKGFLARMKQSIVAKGSTGEISKGKRHLVRNARDAFTLMMPFVVWAVVLIAIYSVSQDQMANISEPMLEVNMLHYIQYGASRCIYAAQVSRRVKSWYSRCT